jgi:hypothetical protein
VTGAVLTIHDTGNTALVTAVMRAAADVLGSDLRLERTPEGLVAHMGNTEPAVDRHPSNPHVQVDGEDERARARRERVQRARRTTVAPAADPAEKVKALAACWTDGMSTTELVATAVEQLGWQESTIYKWLGRARADGLIPPAQPIQLGPISKLKFDPDAVRARVEV